VTQDRINDVGGWAYDANPRSSGFGSVSVNCLHDDRSQNPWFTR
jgi:hypothetical protein